MELSKSQVFKFSHGTIKKKNTKTLDRKKGMSACRTKVPMSSSREAKSLPKSNISGRAPQKCFRNVVLSVSMILPIDDNHVPLNEFVNWRICYFT